MKRFGGLALLLAACGATTSVAPASLPEAESTLVAQPVAPAIVAPVEPMSSVNIASGFLRLSLPGDGWTEHAPLDDGFFYDQPWAFEYASAASPTGWTTHASQMDYGPSSASWWIHVRHTGTLSHGEPVAQAEEILSREPRDASTAQAAYAYRSVSFALPLVIAEPASPVATPNGLLAAQIFAFMPAGPVIQISVGCTRASDWSSRDARIDRVVGGLALGHASPSAPREYTLALAREDFIVRPPAHWFITHQLTDTSSRYTLRRASPRGPESDTLTIEIERNAAPASRVRAARRANVRIGGRSVRLTENGERSCWLARTQVGQSTESWLFSGVSDPSRSILQGILDTGRFVARR